ncbi:MAG: hypothetical protein ACKV2O_08990 [Acidimicrobiales bacterium]
MSNAPDDVDTETDVNTDAACRDGSERFRQQTELRRLAREVELAGCTTAALTLRLRQAEAELAAGSGPIVAVMAEELARWQGRAGQAEAELAQLRGSVLYRLAAPMLAAARVARRGPAVLARLAHRLN